MIYIDVLPANWYNILGMLSCRFLMRKWKVNGELASTFNAIIDPEKAGMR